MEGIPDDGSEHYNYNDMPPNLPPDSDGLGMEGEPTNEDGMGSPRDGKVFRYFIGCFSRAIFNVRQHGS